MRLRRITVAAGALALACAIAACTGSPPSSSPSESTPAKPPPPVTLPQQSLGADVALRLADGVVPPTNRWYSSLAFGDPGLPVFPKPLSFAPTEGGFVMGLTRPIASASTIAAAAAADLPVTIAGAAGYGFVSAADPVGVRLTMGNAVVSLAQGSPVVGVTANAPLSLSLGSPFTSVGEGVGEATINGTDYGIAVTDGTLQGATVQLREHGSAQFFAVPEGGDVRTFADGLGDPVQEVAWAAKASPGMATTTLTYGAKTVVTLPKARADAAGLDCSLGTYATIDGEFAVCPTGHVTWSVPAVKPSATLDLSELTDDQREAILAALKADVAALPAEPSDSYFGGKALYRMANLMSLATALGRDADAATVRKALQSALRDWGSTDRCATAGAARCFVYDPLLKGVVGVTPSFGSEDFNDHHFHYGYLLYAAAVAVADDPSLGDAIGPVFDQVAADIASGEGDANFPAIRTFDPVEGHSWASGYSPFADGNNQESSSEAVSAWNAVALWAGARSNSTLEDRARWMLASEADAARRLWLEPDLAAFPAFAHTIVSLEWGAKRDYATWFSPEPSAMLGIQLIPMAPFASQYLGSVAPEQIAASVAEATSAGTDVQFRDYLLMYQALQGGGASTAAWTAAQSLPKTAIDDADSRTYLLAFLAAAGASG